MIEEEVTQKTWGVEWKIEKYEGRSADEIAGVEPDEVLTIEDNGLLNNGINFLLNRLAGGADVTYPAWNNANAYLKVGNGTAAFGAAQTDLQGGSTFERPMDVGYPSVAAQSISFRATFDTGEANFAWEEMGVKNGAGAISATVKLLNRRVASAGTKAAGSTWTLTLTITIS